MKRDIGASLARYKPAKTITIWRIALKKPIPIAAKVVIYQLLFIVVHYLYDWFPNSLTHFIGATDESVFQHMKAVFFAYLLLNAIEYGLSHKAILSKSRYFFSRIFGAMIMPLLMFIYFLAGAALFIKIESIPLEILFANLVLVATSTSTFLLDSFIEKSELPASLKWTLTALFTLTALELIIFNYRLPWFDIFANPPGW